MSISSIVKFEEYYINVYNKSKLLDELKIHLYNTGKVKNIADDLEYLQESQFFTSNLNNLFKIDQDNNTVKTDYEMVNPDYELVRTDYEIAKTDSYESIQID